MASKVFMPTFSKKKSRLHQREPKVIQRSSNSRDIMFNQVSNHEIYELCRLPKSPFTYLPQHSTSSVSSKDIPSSTPRLSSRSKALTRRRTISSSNSSKKSKILSKFSNKHENLRYMDLSVEDSCKNFNFVSTPPEENSQQDSLSPYSRIVEEQLNDYINSPLLSGIQSIWQKEQRIKMNGSFLSALKDEKEIIKKNSCLVTNVRKKQQKSQNSFYMLKKNFPACFRRSKSQYKK